MMKKLLFTLLFFFVATPAAFAGVKWNIIPEESFIRFSGIQAGDQAYEGEFKTFSADICFDEHTLEDAWARIEFDVASAATGIGERDEILVSQEWMFAKAFPLATFETEIIRRVGPNTYQADGVIAIKGVRRPLILSFVMGLVENTASGAFTIDRRDFNIGEGAWGETEKWVAYAINISFQLAANTKGEECHDR